MAFDAPEELDDFRTEVRDWLEANCPASMRTPMKDDEIVWGGSREPFKNPDSKVWLERMGEKGWTAPEWPAEYGGGGLDKAQARVAAAEVAVANAKVRAPFSGFVTARSVSPGQSVSTGDALLSVVTGTAFEIKVGLSLAQWSLLEHPISNTKAKVFAQVPRKILSMGL